MDELVIIPESCAAFIVDPTELNANSARLAAVVAHLESQAHRLTQVEQALAAADYVPGGVLSAAPARGALALGGYRLRSTIASIEQLAPALTHAAAGYEEAEGMSRRAFNGAIAGAGQWREMYGTWFPAPLQALTAPLNRFFAAGARGQLEALRAAPLPTLASPRQRIAAMFSAGAIYYHQVSALGPTGWFGYGSDVFHTGRLLPKALSPLWNSGSAGLDREEGAILARSLSGFIVPGGDVGEGAGVVAGVVDGLHAGLGHRGFRMGRIPPKHNDGDSMRTPVRTFGGAISVMEELAPGAGATAGELRIDKVTSPEGEDSWQVFIPGGQGFDPGNVHSLLHTVRSVDSRPTPSVAMVAAALREVGAQKGEPIVLVGHSHGGITASNFANDPRLRAEFDVPLVIAAGSPVDLHDIRPDTHVVSFEHTEDVITGVDGVQRQLKPGMTRVERTLADSSDPEIAGGAGIFHSHDYPNYIDTARLADEHPGLEHTRRRLAAIIPDGQVETYRFRAEITR